MVRLLYEKTGKYKAIAIVTLVSVALSDLITAVITYAIDGAVSPLALLISTLVPLMVAAINSWFAFELIDELVHSEARLRQLSITDDLTLAYNRRYFFAMLDQELNRSRRYQSVFSLIILDIDGFKAINDCFGHSAGDLALIHLAKICQRESRSNDLFTRLGGEEFAFLLPETGQSEAIRFAERIRSIIASSSVEYQGEQIYMTVSMGLSEFRAPGPDRDQLIAQVDSALYEAKREGKNRVVAVERPAERQSGPITT